MSDGKFIDEIDCTGWEISTDNGFKPVSKIYKTVPFEMVILTTENHRLECADTHIVFDEKLNTKFVEDLKPGDLVYTDTGPEQVISVEGTGIYENMYDISVEDADHRYWSNGILSHNTTTLVVFFLWYVLFHNDMSVAILANKGRTAQMIISRIQLAYMYLPKFLQQGIPDGGWNKQSFHLENGSRIISAATSSDSIRGDSFNVIYVDECVGEDTRITVRNKETGEIENIPIKELWERVELNKNTKYEVLTPDGFKDFSGMKQSKSLACEVTFEDNQEPIICSITHRFIENGNYISPIELKEGDMLQGHKVSKVTILDERPLYDLLDVSDGHRYLTNGLLSSNCAFIRGSVWNEFWNSTFPTISSGTNSKVVLVSTPNGMNHFYDIWTKAKDGLNGFVPFEINWWDVPGRDEAWKKKQIAATSEEAFAQEYGNSFLWSEFSLVSGDTITRMERNAVTPVRFSKDMKVFKDPIVGHTYFISVDVANEGIDNSAFIVFDITNYPYEEVCCFKKNLPYIMFPKVIYEASKSYNDAAILVESNDIGMAVIHVLNYDFEANLVSTRATLEDGKPHRTINYRLGQRTTAKTKLGGCLAMKAYLEKGKLKMNNLDFFKELRGFVRNNTGSYSAEDDNVHDDLVMAVVNAVWYMNSKSFKYQYDETLADELRRAYDEEIAESILPMPMTTDSVISADPVPVNGVYSGDNIPQEDKDWLLS